MSWSFSVNQLLPVAGGEEIEHGGDAQHGARRHRVPLEPEGQEGRRHQYDSWKGGDKVMVDYVYITFCFREKKYLVLKDTESHSNQKVRKDPKLKCL